MTKGWLKNFNSPLTFPTMLLPTTISLFVRGSFNCLESHGLTLKSVSKSIPIICSGNEQQLAESVAIKSWGEAATTPSIFLILSAASMSK